MKLSPHFQIILGAIIWGMSGPFVKILSLPPTSLSFIRAIVPVIIVLLISPKKIKLIKFKDKKLLLASFLQAVRQNLYLLAFSLTSITNGVIVLYTWPIFATIMSTLILKEKISTKNILLILTAFIGVVIVFSEKSVSTTPKDIIGMLVMIISAIIYAYTVIIFKDARKKHSKSDILFIQNIIAVFLFAPFFFIINPIPNLEKTATAILYSTLIGYLGFMLFFSALKHIKASTASHLAYMEVISAITIGILLFNEHLTTNKIIGGSLIILSAYLIDKK